MIEIVSVNANNFLKLDSSVFISIKKSDIQRSSSWMHQRSADRVCMNPSHIYHRYYALMVMRLEGSVYFWFVNGE